MITNFKTVTKETKTAAPTKSYVEEFSCYQPKNKKGNPKGDPIPMVKISGYYKNLSQSVIRAILLTLEDEKEGQILREFAAGEADEQIKALGDGEILKPELD